MTEPGILREIDEPLQVSAPLARSVAPELCHADRQSSTDYSWYHGFWQYFRIFNLAATPQRHAAFFFDALGGLARDGGHRRVLLSGNADYAMLAHTLRAYRAKGTEPVLSIVDRCETPLFLCNWYAKRESTTLQTHASEILEWEVAEHVDVICTHSFLSQFSRDARPALISKWRELLRPDGKVVTTTRIDPSYSAASTRFPSDRIAIFCERVREEARRWRDELSIDPDEMAGRARLYAERMSNHVLGSREEIIQLFESGGFKFDRLELVQLSGNLDTQQSGPGTSKSAAYVEIVTSRV